MSDLHHERSFNKATQQYTAAEIPSRAPYLILAGDIGRFCDRKALQSALQYHCAKFQKVLYVPGNHEFYEMSRQEGLRIAEEMGSDLGERFVFMNRRRVDQEGIVILGCTLHSLIPEGAHLTNDFARIQGWTVADHNAQHRRDLEWLEQSLADIKKSQPKCRVIIVTHYAPTFLQGTQSKASPKRSSILLQQQYTCTIRWLEGFEAGHPLDFRPYSLQCCLHLLRYSYCEQSAKRCRLSAEI